LNDLVETPTYAAYFDRITQDTEAVNETTNIGSTDQRFNFYDVSLRWLYQISEKDRLRVNFLNIGNKLSFNENGVLASQVLQRQSSLSQNSIVGGIYYEHQWKEDANLSVHLYNTDYKLKALNANIPENQRFLQENTVSETGVKLKQTFNLSPSIRGGLEDISFWKQELKIWTMSMIHYSGEE